MPDTLVGVGNIYPCHTYNLLLSADENAWRPLKLNTSGNIWQSPQNIRLITCPQGIIVPLENLEKAVDDARVARDSVRVGF